MNTLTRETDLTAEEIKALQQEAMLSHEGLNDGAMTVTLTATCLDSLCRMALRALAEPSGKTAQIQEQTAAADMVPRMKMPMPKIEDALLIIADELAADPTEEARMSETVLRNAAKELYRRAASPLT